jgi:signal transduction histidine kinase/ActR/RegA family two-component response regulator
MNHSLQILLVEDSEGDFFLVHEYLKEVYSDVIITHCWRLSEAKECLNKEHFDIILLDLTLPDSNGQESVKEIMDLVNGAPLVVLTGYADKNFAIDTMQLGVQDYLIKDEVTPNILFKSISYSIERNKIQQMFLSNEKRFRSIVENSSDGYALIEMNGKIRDLSPYGKLKVNIDPIDEKDFFKIDSIHPDFRRLALHTFFEVSKHHGEIRNIEVKYKVADNNFLWIESTIYNLLNEPSVGAIVLNYRDITLRKLEEEQRYALIEELIQSNADLKQFGFITSHNLRAPLTNLLAIVDLLDMSKIKDESTIELLDAFKSATFQLNDTLNDLIKVLFIRENKFLALNKIDFQSVVSKNIHDLMALINSADINIAVDFSEAPSVFFDANYLESILLNLMSNSIKFASPERKLEIKMKSRIDGELTILEFSDNGIGMDMERVKDRIFGLYQRFHDRPDSKGIGLYLIHSQVTALGGHISVKSKVNEGTTFYITFKQVQEKVL